MAVDVHVKPGGSNLASCGGVASPCATLALAFVVAQDGDVIRIADNVVLSGADNVNLTIIQKSLTIRGGNFFFFFLLVLVGRLPFEGSNSVISGGGAVVFLTDESLERSDRFVVLERGRSWLMTFFVKARVFEHHFFGCDDCGWRLQCPD